MRAWLEIDKDKIKTNLNKLRDLSKDMEILGVLKAGGYGLGACEYGRVLEELGVKIFAVATLEEGLELRKSGIKGEILIFGLLNKNEIEIAGRNNLIVTIGSLEDIYIIRDLKIDIKAHLNVDTGMGRIGVFVDEVEGILQEIYISKNIILEGIYSHLSSSDDEKEDIYTKEQIRKFKEVASKCNLKYNHILNTFGVLRFGRGGIGNLVRVGLGLHGLESEKRENNLDITFKLKSKIIQVREVPKGRYISYNKKYQTKERELIGTVSIGYGDGVDRGLTGMEVDVEGIKCEVIGSICMDMLMIKIPWEYRDRVEVGSHVEVIGENIYEVSNKLGTIPYEVIVRLGARIKKIYM